MKISVILPSYNYGKFLSHTIESIFGQTLLPDEVIIIDDASTDNSPEIIKDYALQFSQIKALSNETNKGVIHTLNRGVSLAKGKYLLFVSADDPIGSKLIEKSLNVLEKYPMAAFSSALTLCIDEKNQPLFNSPTKMPGKKEYYSSDDVYAILEKQNFWLNGNTMICRRECLNKVGGFRKKSGPLCDSFSALLMALNYGACFIPEYLTFWRKTNDGYCGSTLLNVVAAKEYMNHTQKLIETKYQDVFPEQFLKRWQNEWAYASALLLLKSYSSGSRALQSKLSYLLEPLYPIDILAISFLQKFGNASAFSTKLYMALRFHQLNYNKILSLLKRFSQKKIMKFD